MKPARKSPTDTAQAAQVVSTLIKFGQMERPTISAAARQQETTCWVPRFETPIHLVPDGEDSALKIAKTLSSPEESQKPPVTAAAQLNEARQDRLGRFQGDSWA